MKSFLSNNWAMAIAIVIGVVAVLVALGPGGDAWPIVLLPMTLYAFLVDKTGKEIKHLRGKFHRQAATSAERRYLTALLLKAWGLPAHWVDFDGFVRLSYDIGVSLQHQDVRGSVDAEGSIIAVTRVGDRFELEGLRILRPPTT